jgi:flagellar hook-basal body complex protein FliE
MEKKTVNSILKRIVEILSSISFVIIFIGIVTVVFGLANSFISPSILNLMLPDSIVNNLDGNEINKIVFLLLLCCFIFSFLLGYIVSFRYEKTRKEITNLINSGSASIKETTKNSNEAISNLSFSSNEAITSIKHECVKDINSIQQQSEASISQVLNTSITELQKTQKLGENAIIKTEKFSADNLQQIFSDIKLEFEDASLKLSAKIDDNLYTFKRLKKDLVHDKKYKHLIIN